MNDFLRMIQNYGQDIPTNVEPELQQAAPTQQVPTEVIPDQQAQQVLDPRMQQAIEERDRRERMAMLLSGFRGLAQAGVAASGSNAIIGDDAEKMLMQRAQYPVKDLQTQQALSQADQKLQQDQERHQATMQQYAQKLAMGDFDLTNRERLMDPNSKESKFAQDYLMDLNPGLKNEDIREIPAAQLYKNFLPQMQQLMLGKMRIEAQQAQLAETQRRTEIMNRTLDLRRDRDESLAKRHEDRLGLDTDKFGLQKEKQQTARADVEEKKRKAKEAADRQQGTLIQDANRALEIIEENPNAVGPLMGKLGYTALPTQSRRVKELLESMEANIGFEQLNAMRQNSPTGGALGNVTELQLQQLNSVLGRIKVDSDPKDVQENIKRVVNMYNDIIHGPGEGPKRYDLAFDDQGRRKSKVKQAPSKVMMTTPDGRMIMVPKEKVKEAIERGAKVTGA
jgi:hypothetical protein